MSKNVLLHNQLANSTSAKIKWETYFRNIECSVCTSHWWKNGWIAAYRYGTQAYKSLDKTYRATTECTELQKLGHVLPFFKFCIHVTVILVTQARIDCLKVSEQSEGSAFAKAIFIKKTGGSDKPVHSSHVIALGCCASCMPIHTFE